MIPDVSRAKFIAVSKYIIYSIKPLKNRRKELKQVVVFFFFKCEHKPLAQVETPRSKQATPRPKKQVAYQAPKREAQPKKEKKSGCCSCLS